MPVCTFLGHRDCPAGVCKRLKAICKILIEQHKVDRFYVGNQGSFDRMVARILQELAKEHPRIDYEIVLAYHPPENAHEHDLDWSNTLLPSGIEHVPPRIAIAWRNQWMVDQSDYVVAYVIRSFGGAFRYMEYAKKKGKQVINLANVDMPAGTP